jgi:hypothetical protein
LLAESEKNRTITTIHDQARRSSLRSRSSVAAIPHVRGTNQAQGAMSIQKYFR